MKELIPPVAEEFSNDFPARCGYEDCPSVTTELKGSPDSRRFYRKSSYFRADDRVVVFRFGCRVCRRSFSKSRLFPCFGQKKRSVNSAVLEQLSSATTQRRTALLLRIDRSTVARKLLFLAPHAQRIRLLELSQRGQDPDQKVKDFQLDELETSEHSKCKPLSVPLAVEAGSRKILSFRVAQMPAKGPLAKLSREKYGKRKDERAAGMRALLEEIAPALAEGAICTSDQNPRYPQWLKATLPTITHKTVEGKRGCITGQGELKKVGFDPIFSLNHSCAMLRANISRLVRRTWSTTKKRERLCAHLELYLWFHNHVLTA